MKNDNIKSMISVAILVAIGLLVALAGSQGSSTIGYFPIYALAIIVAFAIQWIVFIPSYIFKTEKYFDLVGSLTYITVITMAVVLSPFKDLRSLVIWILITIWASRLGTFLYTRIKKAGEDRRFRELKKSFPKFLLTWTLQGLWVTFSLAAALVVLTSENRIGFDIFAIIGIALWLIGFVIEVISDNQKRIFKANSENENKFICKGLWAWSRHPNYFGEILLWIGVAVIASPVLSGWTWVSLLSPVFVTVLLTKISGIPMLGKRADEKWGGQPDYEEYKSQTSVLIPLPPKRK
jgi:steroid 5-alpha reductase family enzyme